MKKTFSAFLLFSLIPGLASAYQLEQQYMMQSQQHLMEKARMEESTRLSGLSEMIERYNNVAPDEFQITHYERGIHAEGGLYAQLANGLVCHFTAPFHPVGTYPKDLSGNAKYNRTVEEFRCSNEQIFALLITPAGQYEWSEVKPGRRPARPF